MQLSKVMIPGNLSEYYKYYKKHFPLPFFQENMVKKQVRENIAWIQQMTLLLDH